MSTKHELNETKDKLNGVDIRCAQQLTKAGSWQLATGSGIRSTTEVFWMIIFLFLVHRNWGKHTSFTNRAGLIVNTLRDGFQPEMCTIAWAKMYEMLVFQDLLPAEHPAAAPPAPGQAWKAFCVVVFFCACTVEERHDQGKHDARGLPVLQLPAPLNC